MKINQAMMTWIIKNADSEELHAFHWIHTVGSHEIHSFFKPGTDAAIPSDVKIRRASKVAASEAL